MKLYSYSTRGYPVESTLVTNQVGIRPAHGFDILVRNKAGRIVDAKSEDYHPTEEDTKAAFVAKLTRQITVTRERLAKEEAALSQAVHAS